MNIEEAKMQNYKIKVANKAESKEAQELLFGLGYAWLNNEKEYFTLLEDHFIVTFSDGVILQAPLDRYNTTHEEHQEITLPQLRDLAVLHHNDVSDATHKSDFVGHKFFVASDNKAYEFREDKWQPKICKSFLEPIVKQESQMTWQDALRAVLEGKEVEVDSISHGWVDVAVTCIEHLQELKDFRIKPQTIHLKEDDYTKEELLKIAGEMK